MRKEPKATAPALTTVSYDIVKVVKWPYPTDEQGLHGWFKIATPSGTTGFVAEGSVRSPGDYHACFERAAGKWLMTAFLAGD